MNEKQEFTLVCIILVAAIILIPLGIALMMHDTDPYRIIEGEPLLEAAEAAGIVVCNITDTQWNLPGATGGKTYILSDNCASPTETLKIETQAFDSAESRDAAIRAYNSKTIGKLKNAGSLIVLGQYLIYVEGSGSQNIFGSIAEELKKLKA